MQIGVEISGFDGLKYLDTLVAQMDAASEATVRLKDAQRALATGFKNQMEFLRREALAVRDLREPWERLARLKERFGDAPTQGGRGPILGFGQEIAANGGFRDFFAQPPLKAIGPGAEIAASGGSSLNPEGIISLSLATDFGQVKESAMELWEAATSAAKTLASLSTGRFVGGGITADQAKLFAIGSAQISASGRPFDQGITADLGGSIAAAPSGIDSLRGRHHESEQFTKSLEYVRALPDKVNQWLKSPRLVPEIPGGLRPMGEEAWSRLSSSIPVRSPGGEAVGGELLTDFQGLKNHPSVDRLTQKPSGSIEFSMMTPYFQQVAIPATEQKHANVLDRNTEAMRRLTAAIENGVFGNASSPSRRAMPSGIEAWWTLDRTAYGQRLLMGGIAL